MLEQLQLLGGRIGRHRQRFMAVAWVTCGLGWTALALTPRAYQADATLKIIGAEVIAASAAHPLDRAGLDDLHEVLTSPLAAAALQDQDATAPSAAGALCPDLRLDAVDRDHLTIRCMAHRPASAAEPLLAMLTVIAPGAAGGLTRGADQRGAWGDAPTLLQHRVAAWLGKWPALRARGATEPRLEVVVEPGMAAAADRGRRLLLSGLVLVIGVAAGGLAAAMAARRDPWFDLAAELQSGFAVPVLGSQASPPGKRAWAWVADWRLGGLVAACGGVAILAALGLPSLPAASAVP